MDDILVISNVNQLHYPTLKDFKKFFENLLQIVKF